MNKRVIIGIIVAIGVGVGVVVASSYNEPTEDSEQVVPQENSEPKEFTITLSEKVGFQEQPP